MKMTKQGAIPVVKEYVWIGKCRNCGSEYEAKREDLCSDMRGHGIGLYAVCELCEVYVIFEMIPLDEMQS
jgi:hypothetical protein